MLQRAKSSELITVQADEEYIVPDNCWAVEILPGGSKLLLVERVVRGSRNIVLLSKIKGG